MDDCVFHLRGHCDPVRDHIHRVAVDIGLAAVDEILFDGQDVRQRDMIKETRTYFCDACGKEIKGYLSSINVIEFDSDGFPESVGYDFCKDCTISFAEWKRTRRKEKGQTCGE